MLLIALVVFDGDNDVTPGSPRRCDSTPDAHARTRPGAMHDSRLSATALRVRVLRPSTKASGARQQSTVDVAQGSVAACRSTKPSQAKPKPNESNRARFSTPDCPFTCHCFTVT